MCEVSGFHLTLVLTPCQVSSVRFPPDHWHYSPGRLVKQIALEVVIVVEADTRPAGTVGPGMGLNENYIYQNPGFNEKQIYQNASFNENYTYQNPDFFLSL